MENLLLAGELKDRLYPTKEDCWDMAYAKRDYYDANQWKCILHRRDKGRCCLCGNDFLHDERCGEHTSLGVPKLVIRVLSYR